MDNNKLLTKSNFNQWATATKQTLNSIEENMVTKADIADMVTKSDLKNFASKDDLANLKSDILGPIEKLATTINDTLSEKTNLTS